MDQYSEISDETDTGTRMNLRQRPPRKSSDILFNDDADRFIQDFDPEKSNRERRKLKKKTNYNARTTPYDEYGHIKYNGADVCDCMNTNCIGCWFECKNCGSTKCGIQCRVNRKFFYETVSFDGKDLTIYNSHFPCNLRHLHKSYDILSGCRRFKTLDGTPLEQTVARGKGNTIFGNTFDIINMNSEELFKYSRDYARELKRSYIQYIFGLPIYNVIDAADAEHVLNDNNLITKGDLYRFLQPFLKTGLLTSTGQKWYSRRKLLTPAFHFKILEQFIDIFKQESVKFINNLESIVNNTTGPCEINLDELIPRFTLNSICETALGVKLDECQAGDEYREQIKIAEVSFIKRVINPLLVSDVLYNTFGGGRNDIPTLEKLHAFSSDIIKKRRVTFDEKAVRTAQETPNEDYHIKQRYAMLDTMLLAETDGLIDHAGICEEVDTFMFEGFDTTSMCLIFALVNLACHPNVQQSCYDEINEFIDDDLSTLDTRQLSQLKKLECVLKETQRLYPSVPSIMRECAEDTRLANNLLLPKGTQIVLHIFDIQRNERYFEKPDEFIPDRFLPENSTNRHPYAFIPFSAGRRNCIGQKFAMIEMKTLIVHILKNFQLLPVTNPSSFRILSGILIRTHNEVFVEIVKRIK